jgi:hypothetical protein
MSREAFEKFYMKSVDVDANFNRNDNLQYRSAYVQYAWVVWQAALQSGEPMCNQYRPTEPCPNPKSCKVNGCSAVEREWYGHKFKQKRENEWTCECGTKLYTTPQPVIRITHDEACLALWKAIRDIKAGNKTDDKLIFENLRKAGVWLCRASAGKETV